MASEHNATDAEVEPSDVPAPGNTAAAATPVAPSEPAAPDTSPIAVTDAAANEARPAPESPPAVAPLPVLEPLPALEPLAQIQPLAAPEPLPALDPLAAIEPLPALEPLPAPEPLPALAPLPALEPLPALAPLPPVDFSLEPDYPPPNSVPRPLPPSALRVYPPPVVTEVTPAAGSVLGETKLTLVGSNLFRATIVRVGGIIAQTVGADEPRELRVLTPAGDRPGQVDISVENPHVAPTVLPSVFRYEALAAPRISSVAPDHVATKGGTELTVMGEHFVKSTVVLFDGKPAENARFVSATAIDVKAPPGEHGKLVDVSVRNPDGTTAVARRAFMHDERFG